MASECNGRPGVQIRRVIQLGKSRTYINSTRVVLEGMDGEEMPASTEEELERECHGELELGIGTGVGGPSGERCNPSESAQAGVTRVGLA